MRLTVHKNWRLVLKSCCHASSVPTYLALFENWKVKVQKYLSIWCRDLYDEFFCFHKFHILSKTVNVFHFSPIVFCALTCGTGLNFVLAPPPPPNIFLPPIIVFTKSSIKLPSGFFAVLQKKVLRFNQYH